MDFANAVQRRPDLSDTIMLAQFVYATHLTLSPIQGSGGLTFQVFLLPFRLIFFGEGQLEGISSKRRLQVSKDLTKNLEKKCFFFLQLSSLDAIFCSFVIKKEKSFCLSAKVDTNKWQSLWKKLTRRESDHFSVKHSNLNLFFLLCPPSIAMILEPALVRAAIVWS